MSAGIKVQDQNRKTLGWVAIDPNGRVRLHGFSEELGKCVKNGRGTWTSTTRGGLNQEHPTRKAALALLWDIRERSLQAMGR